MSAHATLSDTDSIFALAYADAIKKKFQLDVGEHYEILTSPVTQRGPAAGDLIYRQMTNYLIYKIGDALQYSDNPSYTGGSAGSYIQQLHSYLNWVTASGDPSPENTARMDKARVDAVTVNKNYFDVLDQAQAQYSKVKDLHPDLTFWQWTSNNYPPIATADHARRAAQTELYQAMQHYYGPDADTLSTFMTNVADAAGPLPYPGYNMDGLVEDKDMISGAIDDANNGKRLPEQVIAQSTIRVPGYNIPSYVGSLQAWITAGKNGATRDQVIEVDVKRGQEVAWEDFEVSVKNRKVPRKLDTAGRETDISIRLSMIGIGKFNVRVDQWDVANVKVLFPNRLPEAPLVLTPDYARVVSLLVGYDVELRVKFGSQMIDEVDDMYQEVKATKGVLTIFGFRVFAGEKDKTKEQVETRFEDIQWDKESGTIVLTPTAGQVYPTILGVVAQRFD